MFVSARILIVDDYEPWRRWVRYELETYDHLLVVGEVADGIDAVDRAQALQPDLVLLDIGLPRLNGIEAARQILERAPKSKILFFSDQRSADIVREALFAGGGGYIHKLDARKDLLPAVEAVLRGEQFISASLDHHKSHE